MLVLLLLRYTLLMVFAGFLNISGTYAGTSQTDEESRPPNVLLILVDDLKPVLGVYGDELAITPELDKLSERGMRFDRAYSNQAVCAPSRLNLMLGSRSTSTGIYDFGRNFRDYYPDALTLPQLFKQSGYHVESMGKVFHIGHNTYNDEASWSVEHHSELVIEYVDPQSTPDGLTREEALFDNYGWDEARELPRGPAWEAPDVGDDAYADGRIAARAVERLGELSKDRDQPFFMAVGFARPHLPFSVPKRYWDLYERDEFPLPETVATPVGAPEYAGKRDGEIVQYSPVPHSSQADPFPEDLTRALIHGYYASSSYVDAQIGKVIDELERLGLDENTIIVLWGDHGFLLGEMGIWTKHVNYELASRIPLLMVAPGVTQAGSSTLQLSETVDIYPTLAELAGLAIPETSQPLDGVSLVGVLKDPQARVRGYAYHAYPRGGRMGRAIRTDQYRLVEWKAIGADDDTAEFELYDYVESSVEYRNIADETPAVVDRLRGILSEQPPARPARPASRWQP